MLAGALLLSVIDTSLALIRFDGSFRVFDAVLLLALSDIHNMLAAAVVFFVMLVPVRMSLEWLQMRTGKGIRTIAGMSAGGFYIVSVLLMLLPWIVVAALWGLFIERIMADPVIEFPEIPIMLGAFLLLPVLLVSSIFLSRIVFYASGKDIHEDKRSSTLFRGVILLVAGIFMALSLRYNIGPLDRVAVNALVMTSAYILVMQSLHDVGIIAEINRARKRKAGIILLLLHFLLMTTAVLSNAHRPRRLLNEWTLFSVKLVHAADVWFDLDSDGYRGHWAGGPDCDDTDPRVNPDGREIPHNGVDENCTRGDLTEDRVLRRPCGTVFYPQNVRKTVLLSIDALRADMLCVGQKNSRKCNMPNVSRFLEKGTYFSRAYSTSNYTAHSVSSILSGMHVSRMRRWQKARSLYTIAFPFSLPVMLKSAGIFTAHAVTFGMPSPIADSWDSRIIESKPGLVRALARKEVVDAPVLSTLSVDILRREILSDRKYMLWIHSTDLHAPYTLPDVNPSIWRDYRTDYEGLVKFVDSSMAPLLDLLSSPDFRDVAVIFFADHGEELGRRPARGHGMYLYDTSIRVPLGIVAPGFDSRIVDKPVSLVDLAPTVLSIFGLPLDPRLDGKSLIMTRVNREEEYVFAETRQFSTNTKMALVHGRYKIIRDLNHGYEELYDLKDDPREHHDIADENTRKTAEMSERLDLLLESFAFTRRTCSPHRERS